MENKKNGVTIADLLMIIGFAGIGICSFLGAYMSMSMGMAILYAIVIVGVLAVLLTFAIVAKGKTDNYELWVWVKWGAIVLYFVAAVFFSGPFQRFFYVASQKENLSKAANEDITTIDALYLAYEQQRSHGLAEATNDINNYMMSGDNSDPNLRAYVQKNIQEISLWSAKADKATRFPGDSSLSVIKDKVSNMSFMDIPVISSMLMAKMNVQGSSSNVWNNVDAYVESLQRENDLIPVIKGQYGEYSLQGYLQYDLGNPKESQFVRALNTDSGDTVFGWIIYIVLNLMILTVFVVARGTNVVGPGSNVSIGGARL